MNHWPQGLLLGPQPTRMAHRGGGAAWRGGMLCPQPPTAIWLLAAKEPRTEPRQDKLKPFPSLAAALQVVRWDMECNYLSISLSGPVSVQDATLLPDGSDTHTNIREALAMRTGWESGRLGSASPAA